MDKQYIFSNESAINKTDFTDDNDFINPDDCSIKYDNSSDNHYIENDSVHDYNSIDTSVDLNNITPNNTPIDTINTYLINKHVTKTSNNICIITLGEQLNNIKDYEIITHLYIKGCKQIEQSMLNRFINLTYLNCSECPNIRTFKFLKNLEILICNDCLNLEDFCCDNLTKLKYLECRNCVMWTTFIDSPNLEFIDCSGCKHLLHNSFHESIHLKKLICVNSGINNNSFIKLNKLKILDCSHNKYINDDCFKGLYNLKILICSHCPSLNNDSIKHLSKLKRMCCSNCPNLKSFNYSNFKYLEQLDCSNCFDISNNSFHELSNLKYLNCSGCKNLNNDSFTYNTKLICLIANNITNFDITYLNKLKTLCHINIDNKNIIDEYNKLYNKNIIYNNQCDNSLYYENNVKIISNKNNNIDNTNVNIDKLFKYLLYNYNDCNIGFNTDKQVNIIYEYDTLLKLFKFNESIYDNNILYGEDNIISKQQNDELLNFDFVDDCEQLDDIESTSDYGKSIFAHENVFNRRFKEDEYIDYDDYDEFE